MVYNFNTEMTKFCNLDVDFLRRSFQKFREMFITLKNAEGMKQLRQAPLHYMTIAALAYDGIIRGSYLPLETLK